MPAKRSFDIDTPAGTGTDTTLVVGQAHPGMAGVTAADYLVRHLDATQIGHLSPAELPGIAPFEEGVPRHHSRFYTLDSTDLTVLVEELFIPVTSARPYADALIEWIDEQAIEEVVVLHGVPFPHGPDEHEVFHVSTPGFRETRLADGEIPPLKGGFLDGVVGELVTHSLDEAGSEIGVFVTPTHPPGPDIDAALKLLDVLTTVYGFEIDETELRELGEQFKQYYEQLANRMASVAEESDSLGSHDYPEDRMYM
ncbi:proteasome assembly chaperone family protein [Haloarcula nitratireducens]|uniref:PAC2 family protein n=1 Tax=Haloarcula nitratireducens TaxID=2487749 RepID=A0AAW4PD01_9EURY|nr:PAC2 family protein [Halomicroarcula nitratireducens]MBX0295688.1 PAC2 family protein [Halomicroarcula nitratireducens]